MRTLVFRVSPRILKLDVVMFLFVDYRTDLVALRVCLPSYGESAHVAFERILKPVHFLQDLRTSVLTLAFILKFQSHSFVLLPFLKSAEVVPFLPMI